MPNANVQFQGQTLPIPGSYYADNVQNAQPANPALVPPMVFIAYGYGGKPLTPLSFPNGGGQALLSAMRGAPSSDFVPFIANPSTSLYGASEIVYINCSENTQSSLTLKNASGINAVELTSADYGPPSNLLMAGVTAGSTAGIAMTLFDGYTGKTQATCDNLGVPFQIAYTGSGTGVTFTVTAVSGIGSPSVTGGTSLPTGRGASTLALTSSVDGESYTLQLGPGQYDTVAKLVNFINTTGSYVAQVLPNVANGQLPTQFLDVASAVALPAPASNVNQFISVTAGVGSVLFWVNRFASNLAVASGVISGGNSVPADIDLTHFAGAVAGPPTLGDYADAFTVAASINAWTVFADSNDPGIVALGVQHAFDMSQPDTGKWRRFITGSSIGDTVNEAKAVAQSMNAQQATYVYPGVYRTDGSTNSNALYDGLHAAAAVASIMAGNIIAQPLTMQTLIGNGVETALTLGAGGQIDTLQQAGVMPIYTDPQTAQPTIVSDFTTWQNDNNPENIFNQQIACRQGLAYSLSQGLKPYIGQIASPYGIARVRKAAISILNKLIYSPGNNGILVSWDAKSLVLNYDGSTQTLSVTVNVVFVGQIRFILELAFVMPLNLAA